MEDEDAVEIKALSKLFAGKAALEGVSLKFRKGSLAVVAGPNASGKTTLLNIIAGVLAPTEGKVEVAAGMSMGYSYQQPELNDDLTVSENISFFSEIYGARDRKWIEKLLALLEIDKWLNSNAGKLSSGMRKRLELAIALLPDPELIMLDEPTAGLDPDSTRQMLSVIKLFKENGKTIIIATHQLEDFGGLCDHLVIIRKGRVLLDRQINEGQKRRLGEIYKRYVKGE